MSSPTVADIPDPNLPPGIDDAKAIQEEANWNRYEAINRQKGRNAVLVHKTIGYCIPVAIVLAVALFLATVIVYTIHLLIPINKQWLSKEQLDVLHNMIFSGVVGAAVATAARIYLLDGDKRDNDRR